MGHLIEISSDSFVILEAVDPRRNVARRYAIEISIDLFGATVIDYAWGRIGTGGQRRRVSFMDRGDASTFVRALIRRRASARRRIGVGYAPVAGSTLLSVG